jgi:hypothetical protein
MRVIVLVILITCSCKNISNYSENSNVKDEKKNFYCENDFNDLKKFDKQLLLKTGDYLLEYGYAPSIRLIEIKKNESKREQYTITFSDDNLCLMEMKNIDQQSNSYLYVSKAKIIHYDFEENSYIKNLNATLEKCISLEDYERFDSLINIYLIYVYDGDSVRTYPIYDYFSCFNTYECLRNSWESGEFCDKISW